MPILHSGTDAHSSSQKLSKIETLRLARNYIMAMSQTLQEGKPMDIMRFIKILSRELSQTTANLLNGTLMGPVNNSLVAYRRYVTNDYPASTLQECSNIPCHIDWQDFNSDYGNNNAYNTWYPNYKCNPYSFSANNRYDSSFRYSENYATSGACFHEGYSKQLLCTTEW